MTEQDILHQLSTLSELQYQLQQTMKLAETFPDISEALYSALSAYDDKYYELQAELDKLRKLE